MAVYTQILKNDLIAFLENYNIGELVSFSEIKDGIENSNFLLITHGGKFILTLFERRTNLDDLPFFLNLMTYLSKYRISCPQPIFSRQKKYIGAISGRAAVITTFLSGQSPRVITSRHCGEVGKAL